MKDKTEDSTEKHNFKKMNNVINKSKIYWIYTILFCVISIGVFAVFIKMNKGFIWGIDGLKQHFTILYDFNQIMRNIFQDGFPMLSWDMGLGMDVIRTVFLLHFRRSFCLY